MEGIIGLLIVWNIWLTFLHFSSVNAINNNNRKIEQGFENHLEIFKAIGKKIGFDLKVERL